MKKITSVLIIIVAVLAILTCASLRTYAQESVTINLNGGSSLSFVIPAGWSLETDEEGNFMFSNTNRPGTFYIFLVNYVYKYNSLEEKQAYINAHKQEMLKDSTVEISEGSDEVLGINVPYLIMPDNEDPDIRHKIFYVFNNSEVYIFTATLTKEAPVEDGEALLNSVGQAIINR